MPKAETRPRGRHTAGRAHEQTPVGIRVRMYQVGFGDCFLLTFEYAEPLDDGRSERHVLIDFGTIRHPARRRSLKPIAELINEHCGGQLDVVVVTHRHKDHLSAFADEEIAGLLASTRPPALVVRSWTEAPGAEADAPGPKSATFLSALTEARGFADGLVRSIRETDRSVVGHDLRQLADDQIANAKAITQLNQWSDGSEATYVYYGQKSGIEDHIPGLTVRVLGPPTIDQYPEVRSQDEDDPDEFWMLYRNLVQETDLTELTDDGHAPADRPAGLPTPIGPTSWLIDRMGRQQANSFLRIVRVLDNALNNTSLILLFELESAGGTKRLLFGGDAQIENWRYALAVADDHQANLEALELVDLYKVGHHGSRNATPRTLFGLWDQPDTHDRDMVALMSTLSGVFDNSPATTVPRSTLVEALKNRMTLYTTDGLTQDYVELAADLTNGGEFVAVTNTPPVN